MRSHISLMACCLSMVLVVYLAALPLAGQDIDSVLVTKDRGVPSIAAEIHDPSERVAFLALYKTKDPATVQALSRAFLQTYPRSAFLATAYELAARSSLDLGDLPAGLDLARKSLVLWPENPLLLVAVADVQARTDQQQAALVSAQDSLYYLDRLIRPAAVSARDWPHVQHTAQATAWFVIGRVQASRALGMPLGPSRRAQLDQAIYSLSHAHALNPGNAEITYLRGLVYLATGQMPEATADFAAVYKQGGNFGPKAREELLAIHTMERSATQTPETQTGFSAFLSNALKEQAVATTLPVRSAIKSKVRLPSYAGSAACNVCHSDIYRQWKQTGMAKMLRPYQPENVIGDFVKDNEFYAGDDVTYSDGKLQITPEPKRELFARMVLRNGRHYFEIKQSDGQWHTYKVDYTIGSKWQQAYATVLPNGEIHVFPIEYSRTQKRWVNYWKLIDPAGTERSNPYNWEKLDNATSYLGNCAVCHTSQLRDTGNSTPDPDHFAFREPGINCEMCHGPSAAFIAAIEKGDIASKNRNPTDPPVEFDRISNQAFVDICARCHMQSRVHSPSPLGELNYSSTGTFSKISKSVPLDEFSRKAFYKDGRFRYTTFIVEALERTKCFRTGGASCGTCHNPHGVDAASNPTSLKFRHDPDLMCVGCHTQFQNKANVAAHTHHPVSSEASRCVSCHMPRIVNGLLRRVRSHEIDDIPNAQMTERFGPEESPNACLLCHTEKTAQWVQNSLESWKTMPPRVNSGKGKPLATSSRPGQ